MPAKPRSKTEDPDSPIYLDNNATTPVDPRVLEAMLPYLSEWCGNAGSAHAFGLRAHKAVDRARHKVARCLGAASPAEIVFTSGATESDNLAIKGIADALGDRGDHIVTVITEHPAVLDSCRRLEREGFEVTYLGVGQDGLVDPGELSDSVTDRTILVSVMAANNEIGVLQDIARIARLCRERDVLFHTDATQAIGKIPFDVRQLGVDLASFTAHKIYGPKGIGGLYVRSGEPQVRIAPQIDGGGQESGIRSGTLNVPGIVGLSKALELCAEEHEVESRRLTALRERFLAHVTDRIDGVHVNGHRTHRLPGHLSLSFERVRGARLLDDIQEIALSTTAACHSGDESPSPVLRAIGLSDDLALGTVRIGIGRFNTQGEVDYAAGRIVEAVRRQREQGLRAGAR